MPLTFLEDRLYTDFSYYQSHFTWQSSETLKEPLIYHAYWHGALTELHELSLMSLIHTQSPPFEIWLWMPPECVPENRDFLNRHDVLASSVTLKAYVPEYEATGTPFDRSIPLLRGEDRFKTAYFGSPVYVANALRLLALGKYGGLYFDIDTLFLRDLRPLCAVEFFYQWSDQPYGNDAVCRFRKDSQNLWTLAKRSIEIASCRPVAVLQFAGLSILPGEVYVFPSFVFDPLWIAHDRGEIVNSYCNRFGDFFSSTAPISLAQFFPGAYAYHWHNYWQATIAPHAIAGQLRDEIRRAGDRRWLI